MIARPRNTSPWTWRLKLLSPSICLIFLAVASTVSAQAVPDGSVRGIVRDEQGGVLAGATIVATSPTAPGSYSVITDAAGQYRLVNLLPGEYTIAVSAEGFAPFSREHVLARAGLNIGLDVVLRVGGVQDAVRVTTDTPLLETRTATTAVNISGDLQRKLPLAGRNSWTDFMLLVPGAVPQESFNGFFYAIHGAGTGSKVVLLDGQDANGADSASAAPDLLNISNEAIADAQVMTGGVPSSTPLGESAVINVITKAGTDRFAGSFRLDLQPLRLSDTNVSGGTSNRVSSTQVNGTLGGPVLPRRAWFFTSYQNLDLATGIYRSSDRLATLQALAPFFVPFDNERTAHYYYLKSTQTLSNRQHFDVTYRYDPTNIESGSDTAAQQFTTTRNGGHAVGGTLLSAWTSVVSTEARAAYNNTAGNDSRLLRNDQPSRSVYAAVQPSSGGLIGTGLLGILDNTTGGLTNSSDKFTASFDASLAVPHLIGRHEFRAGLFFQRQRIDNGVVYPAGGFAQEDLVVRNATDLSAGTVPFHRVVYDGDTQKTRLISNEDVGVYLEDTWTPMSRLTISAGVRVDRIQSRDLPFSIQTQDSTDVGPRFGATYALTRDAHNMLRFSATRRHDAASSTAVSASTNVIGRTDSYDLNRDGTFETVFVTPGSSSIATDRIFAPTFHQPYVDEYSLGYQRQLSGGVTLGATFIRQIFSDRPVGIETNGIYDDDAFVGYRNTALNNIYLVTNNTWNSTSYRGIELQAAKQASRISLLASYTRQWRHLSGTWVPNDPAGIIQPDVFANDRGLPDTSSTGLINNLAGSSNSYQQGGAQQWRDHVFSVSASWSAPFHLQAAGNYVYASGLWSGAILTSVPAADPRFGPATLRMPDGRLVQNPLATTLRFLGPTRADGQFVSPALHRLGLSVGRTFQVGHYRIEPTIRGFNVTNHGADQALASQANRTFSPTFRQFTLRQPPRAVAFACRVIF